MLKLLTILLSGSPYLWWTRQQVTAGLIRRQSQLKKLMSLARHRFRAISAKIVELAGINQFQMFVTVNIKKFGGNELALASAVKEDLACPGSSPLNKSDQVISCGIGRRPSTGRAPDPGLKPQAPSYKASSRKRQAASPKLQASSSKPQATSSLILDPS